LDIVLLSWLFIVYLHTKYTTACIMAIGDVLCFAIEDVLALGMFLSCFYKHFYTCNKSWSYFFILFWNTDSQRCWNEDYGSCIAVHL